MKLKTAAQALKRFAAIQTNVVIAVVAFLSNNNSANALCGKVDAGAIYAHIDVLNFGHTDHVCDMGGIKADSAILLVDGYGFALKPNIILAGNNDSYLFVESIGLGHCTPITCITKDLVVTPSVGVQFTQFKTEFEHTRNGIFDVHESFSSISPYVALEVCYTFCTNWRICGMVQYAWSRTHTTIKGTLNNPFIAPIPIDFKDRSKSNTEGPSYSAMLEYDVTKKWSVNIGATYNISLSHEKHGLRGYGVKLGTAYWF
jgi:hypothetical protein